MQAALDLHIPGLHQMPADRPGRRIDHATFASRQLRRRPRLQLPKPDPEIGARQGQSLKHQRQTGDRRIVLQDGSGMWRLDLDALRDAFRARPAAYILCSPHNPVGRVHDRGELEAVVQLAHEYGVRVISTEIHAPLVLEGAAFTPLLTVPGAAEIAVSLVSVSKGWNLAGLKCAAIVAGSPAMQAVVGQLPPDGRWRIGHFGVLATVAALTTGQPWLDALLATLSMRRRQLGDLIAAQLPDVRWQPPQATYLAWLDCRRIGDGEQPRNVFLDRGRVALEPGLRFGTPGSGFVRLNFGTSEAVLAEAIDRMASALS